MSSLISDTTKAYYETQIDNIWDTFKRPITIYTNAQVAYISTNPNYTPFGQHDQNVFAPPVTPQPVTIFACILYNVKQPWTFIEPATRSNFDQLKLRNSLGQVRIKVDPTGNAIMASCKRVQLDGQSFELTSTQRVAGLFVPSHYTYMLDGLD